MSVNSHSHILCNVQRSGSRNVQRPAFVVLGKFCLARLKKKVLLSMWLLRFPVLLYAILAYFLVVMVFSCRNIKGQTYIELSEGICP